MSIREKESRELVERFVAQTEKIFAEWGYQISDEQRQRFLKTHVVDSYTMMYTLWGEWKNPMKGTMPSVPMANFVMMVGRENYKKCECSCHIKDSRALHIVACCDRGYVEV